MITSKLPWDLIVVTCIPGGDETFCSKWKGGLHLRGHLKREAPITAALDFNNWTPTNPYQDNRKNTVGKQ